MKDAFDQYSGRCVGGSMILDDIETDSVMVLTDKERKNVSSCSIPGEFKCNLAATIQHEKYDLFIGVDGIDCFRVMGDISE